MISTPHNDSSDQDPPSEKNNVIHTVIGFSGSRLLYINDNLAEKDKVADRGVFEKTLAVQVSQKIKDLFHRLNRSLEDAEALSQIAIGADMVFTRSCQMLNIQQRLCLPQPFDHFLDAVDTPSGYPDFSDEDKMEARELRKHPNFIEEKVVSHSTDRELQFQETNQFILEHCNLAIAIIRDDVVQAVPGGALDFLHQAINRGIPILELRVHAEDGMPLIKTSSFKSSGLAGC